MKYNFDRGDIIRRFGKYNTAQILELMDILDLHMAPEAMLRCASYFGSTERRDPTVEELKMLDRLSGISMGEEGVLLSELYTRDPFCAKTYADMMNKRRELRAETDTPISVGEAMRLATAYLERIGRLSPLDKKQFTINQSCALTENTAGLQDTPISLLASDANGASSVHEGDVFLLLHRGNLPFWKYDSLITPLLSSRGVCESAKAVLTVTKEGLFPLLLRRFKGVCYDLSALSASVHSESVENLIEKYSGYPVLVIPKEDAERVCAQARRMGLRPIVFAAATKEARTTFRYSNGKVVSFETDFLRAILSRNLAVARLPSEDKDACGKITHAPTGFHSCRYLDIAPSQRIQLNHEESISAACGKLNFSPYRTALQTALTSILSNTAAGGSLEDEKIAFALRLPSSEMDENRIGQILSAILGIYRIQCELAIPAAASEILSDDTLTEPELCVFSISPVPTLPSEFTQYGSALYCVSPITDEDGLPDFDALRKMIRELAEFCKQGVIRSVRVLCNERITDAVEAMETDTLSFHLTDGAALTGEEIPLAILIESAEKLPYATIGYVTARENAAAEAPSIPIPLFEEALNRGDCYEILILSEQTDVDAFNLSRILGSRGANCINLFDTTPNGIVARAMMSAQLVILCGEYAPEDSEQISFASRVLHEAGGLILRLGSDAKSSPDLADFTLSDGISSDLLAQISLQSQNLKSFS